MFITSFLTNIFILFIVISASFKYSEDIDKNRPRYTAFFMLISVMLVVDRTLSFITKYIPMFYIIRIIFIIYLRSNEFGGSLYFYNSFIQPFLKSQSGCFLKSQNILLEKLQCFYEMIMERFNKNIKRKTISESIEKIKKASIGEIKNQIKSEITTEEVNSTIKKGIPKID